jgi:hypothetical protein
LNRFDQNFEWTNEKRTARSNLLSQADDDAAEGLEAHFGVVSIVSAGIALMLP